MHHWPELAPLLPRHDLPFWQRQARRLLATLGWQLHGQLPNQARMVIAVAPHTSNWDFVITMAMALALGVKISFLGKHSIFIGPFGALLRRFGGIAVQRHSAHGVVGQLVERFQQQQPLVLGIAPEGTRQKVSQFKSGFWQIAKGAGVPILLLGIDFKTKQVVVGDLLMPSDDFQADCAQMRLFFQQMTPRFPENF